jgi:hypothetical protein
MRRTRKASVGGRKAAWSVERILGVEGKGHEGTHQHLHLPCLTLWQLFLQIQITLKSLESHMRVTCSWSLPTRHQFSNSSRIEPPRPIAVRPMPIGSHLRLGRRPFSSTVVPALAQTDGPGSLAPRLAKLCPLSAPSGVGGKKPHAQDEKKERSMGN